MKIPDYPNSVRVDGIRAQWFTRYSGTVVGLSKPADELSEQEVADIAAVMRTWGSR